MLLEHLEFKIRQGINMDMKKQLESVLSLNSDHRYKFSVSSIAESEELFFLEDNGFVILSDAQGNKFIPIWPEKELSQAYIGQNSNDKIKNIKLEEFIYEIVPDLIKKTIQLAIFPVSTNSETKTALKDFIYDINQYLIENFDEDYDIPYLGN